MFSKKGFESGWTAIIGITLTIFIILFSIPMIREPISNFLGLGRGAADFVDDYCDQVPTQLSKDKDVNKYGNLLLNDKDKIKCREVLKNCYYKENYDPKKVEFLEVYQTKEWQDAQSFCCVWKYKDINPYFNKTDQDFSSCVAQKTS